MAQVTRKLSVETRAAIIALVLAIGWLLWPMLEAMFTEEETAPPEEMMPEAATYSAPVNYPAPNAVGGEVWPELKAVQQPRSYAALSYQIEPLNHQGETYTRWVQITNHSSVHAYNYVVSITLSKPAVGGAPVPPVGGGRVQTRYLKNIGKSYKTQIAQIPPRGSIRIQFTYNEPFQVERINLQTR
jgi:hypothetical protein